MSVGCVCVSELCICDDDDFAHESGDGDNGFFPAREEALINISQPALSAAGDERCHEQGALDLAPSAACFSVADALAALVWMRRDASQRGSLSARQCAEFWHQRQQRRGRHLADAGDGDQHRAIARQRRMATQEFADARLHRAMTGVWGR